MKGDTENINVEDKNGFHYDVEIQHRPQHGFSTAFYRGRIIGQVELGRILPPTSDDDQEWESWEERFGEWKDEVKSNFMWKLKLYFNNI